MKKLMVILAAAVFSTASFAQTQTTGSTKAEPKPAETKPAPQTAEKKVVHSDWAMKDGKMMHCMGDKMAAMTKDVTLKNGCMISTKGEVTSKDGKKTMMANGDCCDSHGKVMPCDKMHAPNDKAKQDKM